MEAVSTVDRTWAPFETPRLHRLRPIAKKGDEPTWPLPLHQFQSIRIYFPGRRRTCRQDPTEVRACHSRSSQQTTERVRFPTKAHRRVKPFLANRRAKIKVVMRSTHFIQRISHQDEGTCYTNSSPRMARVAKGCSDTLGSTVTVLPV